MTTDTLQAESFLLVETHFPADPQGGECLQLARAMLAAGGSVRLHLMQDGVTLLQQDPGAVRALTAEFAERLQVSADDVSLDLRGISREAASDPVHLCSVEALVRTMALPGMKTLWHS